MILYLLHPTSVLRPGTTKNAHEVENWKKGNLSKKSAALFFIFLSLWLYLFVFSLFLSSSSSSLLTLRCDLLISMLSVILNTFKYSVYFFILSLPFLSKCLYYWWPIHYRNVCILYAQQEKTSAPSTAQHLFKISHVHSCV